MSYTVLARRFRSQDFDDLVGQEPIARTLRNAIESNRVAHAYLFCGTRGVGKTSTARILAKALNCEQGPTPKPCGVCDRCRSIAAGDDIDVVEIDGASNRGIDDIRELRNNAIYRPARSPYKIYIIDEVHQVTRDGFNALLKTLEEPPSHVKFIFATTEPQKVPETIRSRCQEFVFRLIPTDQIARRLGEVLRAEKIQASDEVIERVARAGRGSMRDALSLMDQLLSMGTDSISEQTVEYLLGEPATVQMLRLAGALADGDAAAALTVADELLASGYAPEQFVVSLIEHLRRLMLLAVIGPQCRFLDVGSAERGPLAEQSARFEPVNLVYMIQVIEQLRQSVRSTTMAARALVDAALVRLALLDRFADTAELVERLNGSPGGASAEDASKKKAPASLPTRAVTVPPDPAPAAAEAPPAEGVASADLGPPLLDPDSPLESAAPDGQWQPFWQQVLSRLSAARMMTLAGPLAMVRLIGASGATLRVSARADLVRLLSAPQRQAALLGALGRLLGRQVAVEWIADASGPASPPTPRPVGDGPRSAAEIGPAPLSARLSQREVEQIVADAAVRKVLDVFDASVVSVERRSGGASEGG